MHEQGLVSVLKQIHDDLDAAVADAYGWPHDLPDEEILQRLVDLNHERAEEEKRGLIRWLRPDFQCPDGEKKSQKDLGLAKEPTTPAPGARPKITDRPVPSLKKQPWPAKLPERITALRSALSAHAGPATTAELAKRFSRARKESVEELLDTLVMIGQVRLTDDGRYTL